MNCKLSITGNNRLLLHGGIGSIYHERLRAILQIAPDNKFIAAIPKRKNRRNIGLCMGDKQTGVERTLNTEWLWPESEAKNQIQHFRHCCSLTDSGIDDGNDDILRSVITRRASNTTQLWHR
jgi:hypothetical protein